MAVENIRGTASISQNEVNVKSFFEEIFGNAEAQTNPFVNPHSEKTFRPSNAQIEADVKDFFEFISELNEVNNSFGELIDEACEDICHSFYPLCHKILRLTENMAFLFLCIRYSCFLLNF